MIHGEFLRQLTFPLGTLNHVIEIVLFTFTKYKQGFNGYAKT